MVCLMCADTSGVLVGLKTWKYGQNPFEWCPQELCATKSRSCGSLQSWVILSENHQFSRFENFEEIFSFFTKNLQAPIRAAFWLTELLRASLESFWSILSSFSSFKTHRSNCTHQAHHTYMIKSRILKKSWFYHTHMVCPMCADTSEVPVAFKNRKYRPKSFQWYP